MRPPWVEQLLAVISSPCASAARAPLEPRGYGDEAAYTALVAWGYENLDLHDVEEPLEEHVRRMIESTRARHAAGVAPRFRPST